MKNFSNQSGTDYVSLLKYELNEIGLISQDPSLKSYQKDVEQSLLEEEFDIRFSPDKDIQKKLSKLDKKGLERRYQARMLTLEEYRNGMELAKEMDEVIVPESHRQHGGMASSLPDFLKDENAIFGLTGEFPTPTKINWNGIAEAAMVVSAAVAGGIVLDKYKNDKKFSNAVDEGIAKAKAQIFGAAPVIPAVNATVAPTPIATPPEPFLMHDGIKIIGDEQFQKDNVMWLEFAKKYSPQDYLFIKSNNKWIKSTTIPAAGAGGDGFYWNKSFLRMMIENRNINSGENLKGAVATAAHETGHNTVFDTDRMNETYANIFYRKAWDNLSYVNETELNNFYKNFNFSQFENSGN